MKHVPYSCLIADLEFAFVGQVQTKIKQADLMSDDIKQMKEVEMEEFPLCSWKMTALFDERDQGEDYQAQLERRTGKTGEKEFENLKKKQNTELVKEHQIDRGFDIVNTWKIKNKYLL